MKLLIIKKIVKYFTAYFKMEKIEITIVNNLNVMFRDYEEYRDPLVLKNLKTISDFIKSSGINGRTTKKISEIDKYWKEHILKKENE